MTRDVTVVVMTRDRRADLAASVPRHEAPVVVVDNGSTDGSLDAVRRVRPDATVVELGRNLGATARNVGVEHAGTPYVAFADDDSWWAAGALTRAARLFDAHPRLGLLSGRILVGDTGRLDPVSATMAEAPLGQDPDLPGPNVLGFLACGAVVRRKAFLGAGGFDPVVFFGGEEERVCLDLLTAGWGLAYVDDVVAHHKPSSHRGDPGARRRLILRNAVLTAWMRRPLPVALERTRATVREGPDGRAAVRNALTRMPAALHRRNVVPAHVERRARILDRPVPARDEPAREEQASRGC